MSASARLARLEALLGPREAVLLWLEEARAYPTLAAYATWNNTQPLSMAPLVRIPTQVERGVRQTLRGQRRETIEPAVGEAVRQAVFLVELVFRP